MSTPHIAWAFAQRGLTVVQRVVLIALAERANGERTCFPSFPTLALDCEVSERAVIAAVQYLQHERHLIEVVDDSAERAAILSKAGARLTTRSNVYRILRPDDTAPRAPSRHHNGARHAPLADHIHAPRAPLAENPARNAPSTPSEGANPASQGCSKRHHEHARRAPESLNESLHEEKRQPQEKKPTDVRGSPAASVALPQQPKQASQEAQQAPAIEPRATFEGAHRTVLAALAELGATYRPRADSPTLPPMPRLPQQQPISPPPDDEAEPVPNAQRMEARNIVGKLGRTLGHREYAPGRGPALTPAEQIAAAQAPPTITDIHPAVLPAVLAARAALMARPLQRQAVHA